MGPYFALMTFACIFVSGIELTQGQDEKMVVCYFTDWSQHREGNAKFLPSNIDANLCTHLFFAYANIKAESLTIGSDERNFDSVLLPGIWQAKAQKGTLKLVLSLGGYHALISDWITVSQAAEVEKFADNVTKYLREKKFDGLNIDWETPDAKAKESYLRLLKALRKAFDGEVLLGSDRKLILSTEVAASKERVPFYSPNQLAGIVDFVIIMAFDFYGRWSDKIGHHSPLFLSNAEPLGSLLSQHHAVEMWRNAGIPMNKLLLGLAFYGRSQMMSDSTKYKPGSPAVLSTYTKENDYYAYYEICEDTTDWKKEVMDDSRVPFKYSAKAMSWSGYDDPQSITQKAIYVVSRGLAGVMVFSLDMDDFQGLCKGASYPLLRAVNRIFTSSAPCKSDDDCQSTSGACVAGFCGCPKGSFITTKPFCKRATKVDPNPVPEVKDEPAGNVPSEETTLSIGKSRAVRTVTATWHIFTLCTISVLISSL